jgi:hypothetical protein
VYNGHPLDMKKSGRLKEVPDKLRFRLVVDESNQLLLTGGHYSEVVVKAGLTVQYNGLVLLMMKNN